MDFTLNRYVELCQTILAASYRIQTMEAYLEAPAAGLIAILRHDVDRWPGNALRMAQTEHERGIHATYYVRMVPGVFSSAFVQALHDLGHEVGYHYEVLAKTQGDRVAAMNLFRQELGEMRRWVPVRTACMHGSPLSRWDNLSIWERERLADCDLVGEPYLDLDYTHIAYYTDTGRAWDAALTNLRDRAGNGTRFPRVHTTKDLMDLIQRRNLTALCIQTHPERWNASVAGWLRSAMFDWLTNAGKLMLSPIRRHR